MNRPPAGWLLVLLIAGFVVTGCSSGPSAPGAGHPAAAAHPTATPSPSPTVPLPPPQSTGFSGPGAFSTTWRGTKVIPTPCPSGHPLASCFAGTADGTLPVTGDVTLARSMVVGDGTAPAPSGCVTAESDGTVTSTTGAITFHASGNLCGRVSSFVLLSSTGSGSLAGFQLQGVITNNSVTETWTGQVVPIG